MGRLKAFRSDSISANHILVFAATLLCLTTSVRGQEPASSNYMLCLRPHQNQYAPGDTLFFKAYFLDQKLKGVEGKHLMTVFLVNNGGMSVQTVQFSMLAGVGFNQITLPDSLAEGFYTLTGLINGVDGAKSVYTSSSVVPIVHESILSSEGEKGRTNVPGPRDHNGIDRSSANAIITTPGTEFKRRQLVTADIQVNRPDGQPIAAEFSFKVYNKSLVNNDSLGKVEAQRFFQEKDGSSALRISSDQVISNPSAAATTNPFQRIGKVYETQSGQPVEDNTQVLFYLQRSQWYHQTFALNGGVVRLNLPQFTGEDELFYLAESSRGQSVPVRIEWEKNEELKFQSAPAHRESLSPNAYGKFKKNVKVIERSYTAFDGADVRKTNPGEANEFDLVDADLVIRPDQYIPFESLSDMIREVIPAMYHRKHGESDVVRVNLPDPLTSTSNPVYFIDGKATTDTKYFLSIPTSALEYIALVKNPKKLLPLQLLGKNGIVILKTKSGNFAPSADDVSKIVKGLNTPVKVSKPPIGSGDNTTPAFRSTLYWQPSVITKKDGRATINFYTTDDIGEMTIEVEGISLDGSPFFSQHAISVK